MIFVRLSENPMYPDHSVVLKLEGLKVFKSRYDIGFTNTSKTVAFQRHAIRMYKSIGGPKMSGNFVRERQRIVYIYNVHYICKQYVAARARNFQTFLGRL